MAKVDDSDDFDDLEDAGEAEIAPTTSKEGQVKQIKTKKPTVTETKPEGKKGLFDIDVKTEDLSETESVEESQPEPVVEKPKPKPKPVKDEVSDISEPDFGDPDDFGEE